MRLTTYNVLKGPQNMDAVAAELRGQAPDVACLQEVYGKDRALELGRRLGMHVAFFPGNKAILSRYPIAEARNFNYHVGWAQRIDAALEASSTEPLSTRSAGLVSIKVGGKTLDIFDTHLALADEKANATQLKELDALIDSRRSLGHSVLAAGDFNHNFALVRGGVADPKGTFATPTDTFEEFKSRYPKKVVGNVGYAPARAAARELLDGGVQTHWEADRRSVQIGGRAYTPEQAAAELPSGAVKPGSRRTRELLAVVDGISHGGAGKRFDNVLATPDLRFVSAFVNADTRASDHQPVSVEVAWR